jgi:hypothetical protein
MQVPYSRQIGPLAVVLLAWECNQGQALAYTAPMLNQ